MRFVRVTVVLVLALSAALVVGDCAGDTQVTDEVLETRAAVTAYNESLIRAFETLDMNQLNTTATEGQAWTEYFFLAALGEGRLIMHATLISLEFGEVAFPEEGKATVATTEVWDYDHISLDTSETVRTERGVVYHLQYGLVLQDGHWLVDSVTSLDEEPAVSEESAP